MAAISQSTVYLVEVDSVTPSSWMGRLKSAGARVERFSTYQAFLGSLENLAPSPRCVVVNTAAAFVEALPALRHFLERSRAIPAIILAEQASVRTAVAAVREGCFEFLEKPVSHAVLLDVVAQALQWDRAHANQQRQLAAYDARRARLSEREEEVLHYLLAGKSTKQMSALMFIGVATVLKHKASLLRKMGVRSDIELALLASSCDEIRIA